MINLMRWFFGDATDAKCYLGHRFNLEQEDHAVCSLKFEKGQIGIVNVGWFSPQSQVELEVYGTMGHADTAQRKPPKIIRAVQFLLKGTPSFSEPLLNEVQHFVNCVRSDQQPQPSGEVH
jgi:UDP-N-acetylglucosamine 3-dehydrogenase